MEALHAQVAGARVTARDSASGAYVGDWTPKQRKGDRTPKNKFFSKDGTLGPGLGRMLGEHREQNFLPALSKDAFHFVSLSVPPPGGPGEGPDCRFPSEAGVWAGSGVGF